jgi:hypothetical protein
VQLEADDFRLFVYPGASDQSLLVADRLADSGLWFDFARLPQESVVRPKRKPKEWNAYNKSYLYRHRMLTNISSSDLVNLFLEYMRFAGNNEAAIANVVSAGG